MRRLLARRLLVVALVLGALFGCDSGDSRVSGSFDARLSGDVSREMEGRAVFSTPFVPEAEEAITITMVEGAVAFRSLSIVDAEGAIDGEGTYSIDPGDLASVGVVYLDVSDPDLGSLVSTGGSVVVTRYEEARIAGTFSADLASIDGTTQARVTGTFDAVEIYPVTR